MAPTVPSCGKRRVSAPPGVTACSCCCPAAGELTNAAGQRRVASCQMPCACCDQQSKGLYVMKVDRCMCGFPCVCSSTSRCIACPGDVCIYVSLYGSKQGDQHPSPASFRQSCTSTHRPGKRQGATATQRHIRVGAVVGRQQPWRHSKAVAQHVQHRQAGPHSVSYTAC